MQTIMNLKERVKQNHKLKKLVLNLLMPTGRPRPRFWVRWFVNPFIHKKGSKSRVSGKARMDVLPFNKFTMGAGAVIEDYALINNGMGDVSIGDDSFVGLYTVVIGPVEIGKKVIIAQHVAISGLNHGFEDVNVAIKDQKCTTGKIVIEDESWIGANAVVTSGVTVGKHSIVAAGSIVTKDVPPFSIVAGNPARIIKQYNSTTRLWEKV